MSFHRYDKREDVSPGHPVMKTYSHIIMEVNATAMRLLQDTHLPLVFIPGYDQVVFSPAQLPPFRVQLQDMVVILQRKDFTAGRSDGRWPGLCAYRGKRVFFLTTPKTWPNLHFVVKIWYFSIRDTAYDSCSVDKIAGTR